MTRNLNSSCSNPTPFGLMKFSVKATIQQSKESLIKFPFLQPALLLSFRIHTLFVFLILFYLILNLTNIRNGELRNSKQSVLLWGRTGVEGRQEGGEGGKHQPRLQRISKKKGEG